MQHTKTIAERFWPKVKETAGCWPFQGSRMKRTGYGQFYKNGYCTTAHRVAWELTYGPIPDGFYVLHDCDNPPCCCPNHLYLGTQKTNIADCIKKGRFKYPPLRAKLFPGDVLAIRESKLGPAKLSRKYGISRKHVRLIRNFTSWKTIN